MIRALLWKEWQEHKWKLASCCAIVLVPLLMMQLIVSTLSSSYMDRGMGTIMVVMSTVLIPPFIAMGLIAQERSRKTFDTLLALPARPQLIIFAKMFVGVLVCVIPFLLGVIIVGLFYESGPEYRYAWSANWIIGALIGLAYVLSGYLLAVRVSPMNCAQGLSAWV